MVHAAFALPWFAEAGAIVVVASTGDVSGPIHLAARPAVAVGIALLFTRRLWLVLSAVVGSVAGLFGAVAIALNYIDHTPTPAAKVALDAMWVIFVAGVVAAVVAMIVGVLEWRARRAAAIG